MDRRSRARVISGRYDNPKKLILAAADYAEGFSNEYGQRLSPPPELTLAWQVERWGSASVFAGAIPAKLLLSMAVCSNVYTAMQSYKSGSFNLARWAEANPAHLDLVSNIRELRQQKNG